MFIAFSDGEKSSNASSKEDCETNASQRHADT